MISAVKYIIRQTFFVIFWAIIIVWGITGFALGFSLVAEILVEDLLYKIPHFKDYYTPLFGNLNYGRMVFTVIILGISAWISKPFRD